jgi:lysozyme
MISTFNPVEGVASAQGLDVSNFQGRFNWSAARAGLSFGIFRLTEGLPQSGDNSPDPDAAWNHAAIRDAGLVRGAYHFLHPSLSGKAQAEYFVAVHEQLGFDADDMLWLDNETTDGLGPAAVAACAQEFMAELKVLKPNSPMGVYTYISFSTSGYCNGLGKYPLWLAYPNSSAPKPPPPWAMWDIWQWGLRNGTDADAFNGTAAQFHSWIQGFLPPPPGINPVAGLSVTRRGFTSMDLAWDGPVSATSYTVHTYWRGNLVRTDEVAGPFTRIRDLKPAHTYEFHVRAHPGGSTGADASVKATTR